DPERPRAWTVEVPLALTRAQPGEIFALHAAQLVGVDAELVHPVLPGVRGGSVDGEAEPAGVALVVRRGEDHGGRALAQLAGRGPGVAQSAAGHKVDPLRRTV